MESRFKIGDHVWVASFQPLKQTKIPCPVCDGKLKVFLILGNGDHVELPCDYCGRGFSGPTGYDTHYVDAVAEPEKIRIDGIEINITSNGERIEYWSGSDTCHSVYQEDNIFKTYEEALVKSNERRDAWLHDQRTRAENIKKNINKTFAWNAGYHLREVKQLEKKIAYHKDKARLCKERAKETKIPCPVCDGKAIRYGWHHSSH